MIRLTLGLLNGSMASSGCARRRVNHIARRALACGAILTLFVAAPRLHAQEQKPLASFKLACRAFAVSSDGRVACATFRQLKFGHYTIERDNVWMLTRKGKKKEIVDGEKLVNSPTPFSFAINRLAFSPDGHRLTVQMTTDQVTNTQGDTHESKLVDLMSDDGKEIPVKGTKTSVIEDGIQANWLADGATVAYLLRDEDSELLYRVGIVHPAIGAGSAIFSGHFFTAVAWDPAHNSAVAIERDQALSGPIKLVRLDLLRGIDETLAILDGYIGQLALSPSGDKVAYFRDGDTLEVRSVTNPKIATTVHCAYGTFAWGANEQRVLLKRGPEKQLSDLVWVSIPGGNLTPILHDLVYHSFGVSPDGHTLAVTEPGNNKISIYPLP
ncbi:MAG: WD40 repeat domain-containing protein [Candidatus Acidiferrales bacterium]